MRGLRIAVLGPLEVTTQEQSILLSGRRQRELLTVLALRLGHAVSADTIAGCLYGEPLPKTAAESVRMHVTALRRTMAAAGPTLDAAIRTTAGGYQLDRALIQTDVSEAERLVDAAEIAARSGDAAGAFRNAYQATSRWRGEPLQDFLRSPFGHQSAAPLVALHARGLKVLARAALSLGAVELDQALAEFSRAQQWHEWDESLVLLTAHCQYRTGQQQAALATLAAHRRALLDELGLDPSADLVCLEQQVLNHDPGLAEPLVRGGSTPHTFGRRLLGREDELAAAVRAVEDPIVRLVLIGGQKGSGKSALLRELAWRLNAPLVTPRDEDGPYDGLRRALGVTIGEESARGVFADLRPSPTLAMSPLIHELSSLPALVIDDADRLDDGSAAVLQETVIQGSSGITLVMGSTRPGSLLTAWVATGADLRVLHLPPLSDDVLTDVATAYRPHFTAARVADLVRRAGGMLGALVELLSVADLISSVTEVRRLPPDLRMALDAVSVLQPISQSELCGVLNIPAPRVEAAVRLGVTRGVLRAQDGRLSVERSHNARTVSPAEQQRLHRAMAGYLANSVRNQDVVRRGWHLLGASGSLPRDEVGNGVLAAARSAIALGWFAQASSLVTQAMRSDLSAGTALLLRLEQARAMTAQDETTNAAEELWEVHKHAELLRDPEIVTLALLSLQGMGVTVGGDTELLDGWDRLIRDLLPPPGEIRTKALCGAAYACLTAGQMDQALAHLDRAEQDTTGSALDVAMIAHARLLVSRMAPDPGRTARRQLTLLQQACLTYNDPEIEIRTRLDRIIVALDDGEISSAASALRGMAEMADAMGHPQARWITRAVAATIALCEGDLDSAAANSLVAAELGTSLAVPETVVAGAAFQLSLHERRGELGQLRPLLEAMTDPPETIAVSWHSGATLAALAVGDDDAARRHWARIRSRVQTFRPNLLAVTGDFLAADAASAVGDLQTAQLIAARLEPIADRFVIVGSAVAAFGPVARVLALVAERSGDVSRATDMWSLNDRLCSKGALAWHSGARV